MTDLRNRVEQRIGGRHQLVVATGSGKRGITAGVLSFLHIKRSLYYSVGLRMAQNSISSPGNSPARCRANAPDLSISCHSSLPFSSSK